ncbi:hypothetical protein [Bartonella sp. CB178]|uniref:hypothetical protein n=1 Tax=Bartonella sp. CB178 TaxID=3112255 RepID=UPI00300E0AF5
MDQEYLTPEEQNQLEQDIPHQTQEEKVYQKEKNAGEKALEENSQGSDTIDQQHQECALQEDEQKTQKGESPPDPQKDFMGYMRWLGETLHKQGLLNTQQQLEQKNAPEEQQLHAFYKQSVAAVKQKHHDFDNAADFIYDMRANQLAALSSIYPEMADQKVVDTIIGNELKQILQCCAQKNKNPAEVIYSIAQNIGYNNPDSNTAENLREKHNSARTLAAYNGLTTNGPMALDMLDKMSEAEFSTWMSDPKNKATFDHLMQGGRSD